MAFDEIFGKVAEEFGLDQNLLTEMAWRESGCDPRAVGRAGEQGLMQILPSPWQEWAPKVGAVDPFDPLSNVRVAAAYLVGLHLNLTDAGRAEEYWVLVAYTWGLGNVLRLSAAGGGWDQVPAERQEYAVDITLATDVRIMAGGSASDRRSG